MTLSSEQLLREIDALFARAHLRPGENVDWETVYNRGIPSGELYSLKTALHAAIRRLSPAHSSYEQLTNQAISSQYDDATVVSNLYGVLSALRADVEAGFTRSVEELVHADVFADFLEMAAELLDKKFKDAAAVIVGSVLEEHLRKLALAANIPVTDSDDRPLKADTINADLRKADVYNKLEQKSVTAWLDLRNTAAHGRYDEYDLGQVVLLLADVRAFMIRHPA